MGGDPHGGSTFPPHTLLPGLAPVLCHSLGNSSTQPASSKALGDLDVKLGQKEMGEGGLT